MGCPTRVLSWSAASYRYQCVLSCVLNAKLMTSSLVFFRQVWGLMYRASNDDTWLERGRKAWDKMLAMHGQATGGFSGDEGISGLSPDRGTETCTVVETMNSAAEMFLTSGDVFYADIVEKIAFNALPGAFLNGTMWSLNYFQQVNKLDALDSCANTTHCVYCYGLVYECCVGNHAQGWPKFAARQLALVPSPSSPPPSSSTSALTTPSAAGIAVVYYFDSMTEKLLLEDGNVVSLAVQTGYEYPFGNGTITITINGTITPPPSFV